MSAQCPRWTTVNGTCSYDDSGAGEHVCSVLAPGHAKCRCACGVETLRPAGDREVARYEERIKRASVTVDEKGHGRVVAGGVDISSMVSGGTVEFKSGELTKLTVSMWRVLATARGEIELDEETDNALIALGWTSPEGDLLRRRDLQEALGGLGTVLREWDSLLVFARKLAEVNTELTESGAERLGALREALSRESGTYDECVADVAELVERMRGLDK